MIQAESKCPILNANHANATMGARSNRDWWPNQLNLSILHQDPPAGNPLGESFDYAAAFEALDVDAVREDIMKVMVTSMDWWPADFGHYGPFFIRMAWHSAGTYRIHDGRGGAGAGTLRFAPLNSWPDNVNLDKARRLLWPVKQKYGRNLSWADLMVLTGNCALESMGLKTFGFGGGRVDTWEPEEDVNWGTETEWLGDQRYSGDRDLAKPLGAVQMGLIYVNPEGPNGNGDPIAAAHDIRETFGRMAMNDEETVALIAGGHTFGKTHGAADPDAYLSREPEGASIQEQGLGWRNSYGTGSGGDTISSGLEGIWTPTPTTWDNSYFDTLFGYEWTLTHSPAGAKQWVPSDPAAKDLVPDAHDPERRHPPTMLTTDLALRMDPIYEPISRRFHEDLDALADAFARAWFKLTHRDMGPRARYLGKDVPAEELIWQDPVPEPTHPLVGDAEIGELKRTLLDSGLSVSTLVNTAWASASSFRNTDKRGGANGARIRLAPQKDWAANGPERLAGTLEELERIQQAFNDAQSGDVRISLADLIVLGGCAAVEHAAREAGYDVTVPFRPGRGDATPEQTDVDSFQVLEPVSDGFRNHFDVRETRTQEELLVDRAQMLTLTAPEMTVLLGGMRALGANTDGSPMGVFTDRPGVLSNDFFRNLLDLEIDWSVSPKCEHLYEGRERGGSGVRWMGSAVDMIFGSNSQLRAISEVYASDDGEPAFVEDFIGAWDKVMNLDRFD
ncbi:MAG: catalase/peroxidase HPI [Planctomycetota bacterium]|nr:catalase/peroxidase HPI [Planctomycetota bacterium]